MSSIRTILHPTDFSESSRYAFETACALARDHRATLLVLHVGIPSVSPLLAAPPADPHSAVEAGEAADRHPWPRPSDPGVRVEWRLAEGDPAEEILRFAGAVPCDLIVMGSHGRTGLGRLFLGSVAEEVLRQAACPVMVVKTPSSTPPTPAESMAQPGDVIDVRAMGAAPGSARSRRLLRTAGLEVHRLIVRAGQEIPQHTSPAELLVQCLEGRVAFTAMGKTQELAAGALLDLPAGEPHSIRGIADASLLVTALAWKR